MNQSPTVLKFGGTSVEDARAFERAARIVLAQADASPVVVVSAMSRFTDALLASFKRAAEEGEAGEAALTLEEHFERHRAVARELLNAEDAAAFGATLGKARCELAALLQAAATQTEDRPALQDEVVSYGERLSADLLAGALRAAAAGARPARHVDARRCIVTDGQFGQAEPEMKETTRATREAVVPVLEAGEIPVLGGFIASTPEGMTTTLGRGGSDYTAAIVGAALQAREIQIWTDVSGVLTADPRVVAGARSVPRLSYAEAAELAYFGAKVLHPKTILPAVVRGIPVRICNSRDPESESTVINFDTDATPHTVKAIAHKKSVTIVHVTSARMLGAYGFLRALFEVFDRHRTVVDLVTTSEVSVSLSLDGTHALDAVVADLERIGAVKVEHGRAVICVVGEGLRDARGVAAKIFTAVRDINVMLISQGASSINLTFVVDESHAERAVRQLHEAFFEQNTRELYQTAAADD
ncbi:MAG TPA: lysine-sensitive aspartokinase 3 [Pyrinomonadaceae bacterium]|nr:lysine-sensitive aspartokinase 3 [Pyrinomonadaceae bacterium]